MDKWERKKTERFSGSFPVRATKTLYVSVKDFLEFNGPQWAAAIAYYSLLSVFPLLLAAVSIAAFFVNPDWAIDQITGLLGEYLPQGATRIEDIVKGVIDARGGVTIFSLLLLLWSGTRVFGVLAKALNVAFEMKRSYSFLKRVLVELVMALTLGLLFIAAMVSRMVVRFFWNRLNIFPDEQGVLFVVLQLLIPALLLFVVFYLIYRYVPVRSVDSQAALIGSLFTTAVILAARELFVEYLNRFASYNLIYGSLAIVVILIFWTWVMAIIVLIGGQITSEVQLRFLDQKGQTQT